MSPILETIFTLFENDLSPITLLPPLDRRSSTGNVLILTHYLYSIYDQGEVVMLLVIDHFQIMQKLFPK